MDQTWITVVAVAGWIVLGMVVTGVRGAWWVSFGAVVLAVSLPPFTYRYAKGAMLRLLHRFDPPEESST